MLSEEMQASSDGFSSWAATMATMKAANSSNEMASVFARAITTL